MVNYICQGCRKRVLEQFPVSNYWTISIQKEVQHFGCNVWSHQTMSLQLLLQCWKNTTNYKIMLNTSKRNLLKPFVSLWSQDNNAVALDRSRCVIRVSMASGPGMRVQINWSKCARNLNLYICNSWSSSSCSMHSLQGEAISLIWN